MKREPCQKYVMITAVNDAVKLIEHVTSNESNEIPTLTAIVTGKQSHVEATDREIHRERFRPVLPGHGLVP